MSLIVIGLNQRLASLDLLERMNVPEMGLSKALHDVMTRDSVSEAVILSTCNRTEVYLDAERFHSAYDDVRTFLSETGGLMPEQFADSLYAYYDTDAARHLFEVAAGVDSIVLGETDILGQVRRAWEVAQREGAASTALNPMFRQAVEVGKRVRTDTGISRHITSVSQAAVAMAAQRLDSLTDRQVLLIGAGEMGEGMAVALKGAGVSEVLIANRTWEKGVDMATRLGGTAVALADLTEALLDVDVLLTSTGASSIIVENSTLDEVQSARNGRELLIVDIAVPRDVDPRAGEVPGITLLNMDDLEAFADAGLEERRREVSAVQAIIGEEIDRFVRITTTREVEPLIAALHERGRAVRDAELERFAAALADLDPSARTAVESLAQGILGKLLHEPTAQLKAAAGSPRGDRMADAMRDLFDL